MQTNAERSKENLGGAEQMEFDVTSVASISVNSGYMGTDDDSEMRMKKGLLKQQKKEAGQ